MYKNVDKLTLLFQELEKVFTTGSDYNKRDVKLLYSKFQIDVFNIFEILFKAELDSVSND